MNCIYYRNGYCRGTAERDPCSYDENKSKCGFYSPAREKIQLKKENNIGFITAAEAHEEAVDNVSSDFEDTMDKVENEIIQAVNNGRMKIFIHVKSYLMREKIATYLEKLGYLISYPTRDDSLKYENNGCYMYIAWG